MRLDMPCMETKHLYLRPLEEADACDMYSYCADKETTRFLSFPAHVDVDHTLHMMHHVMLPYAQLQDFETLAILDKESEHMIGHIHLHSLDEDRAQIGYVLHKDYWHRGLAKEALTAVMELAFTWCGLHRVEALYEVHHEASAKVLAACGFHAEGVLRQYTKLSDGRYHDMVLAARLADDKGENTYEKRTESEI